jgi:membrane protease YdiL (CAAX protease family)
VGLEGGEPNAFWNALPLGLFLMAVVTFFNWAYSTFIFPDIEMQAGIAELIQGMATNPVNLIVGVITIACVVPVVEELLFRGLLQNALMKRLPPLAAIAVAAFLFSIVHMQPYAIPPLFALGFAFGYLYWKTGSLKTNIGLHMLNNAAATALTLYAA